MPFWPVAILSNLLHGLNIWNTSQMQLSLLRNNQGSIHFLMHIMSGLRHHLSFPNHQTLWSFCLWHHLCYQATPVSAAVMTPSLSYPTVTAPTDSHMSSVYQPSPVHAPPLWEIRLGEQAAEFSISEEVVGTLGGRLNISLATLFSLSLCPSFFQLSLQIAGTPYYRLQHVYMAECLQYDTLSLT